MQKVRGILVLLILFLFTSLKAFAGGEVPCSGDPDDPGYNENGCTPVPLDNWVIVLVAGGLIFTTIYLHNKQKKEAVA